MLSRSIFIYLDIILFCTKREKVPSVFALNSQIWTISFLQTISGSTIFTNTEKYVKHAEEPNRIRKTARELNVRNTISRGHGSRRTPLRATLKKVSGSTRGDTCGDTPMVRNRKRYE